MEASVLTPSLLRNLSVYSDGSVRVWQPLLCRLKHDAERDPYPERGFITDPIPEPFRAEPDHQIAVKNYPALFELLCDLNPEYTRERVTDLLGKELCWTNQQWGVFHAPIITGGAVMEVHHIEAGRVYVNSIDINGHMPTADYVLAHHLSALGVSVHKDRSIGWMTRPNGYRNPDGSAKRSKVRMFIVRDDKKSMGPLWFPASDVQILPSGFAPDELWVP